MKYADTESHAEEIMRILYIRILFDWKYAKHMAYICARLVKIPKLGTIFRTSLIRRIQLDYGSTYCRVCFVQNLDACWFPGYPALVQLL